MTSHLDRLAHLIAAEENPHELIARVAADFELLGLVRNLNTAGKGATPRSEEELVQACQANHIPINYFWDRLNLISRILNLAPAQDDYYEVLEVSRDATREEIKHAFRRLSLAHHPDVNRQDPHAAGHFQRIHQAYEMLSDTRLKEHYDRSFAKPEWVEPNPSEHDFSKARRKRKRVMILPFALLISVFLALIFLVDYQSWLTERYYRGHAQPASEKNSLAKRPDQIDQNSAAAEVRALAVTPLACLDRQGGDCVYFISASTEAKDGGLLTNPTPRYQIASLSPMDLKEGKQEGAELTSASKTPKTSSPNHALSQSRNHAISLSPHLALSGNEPKPKDKNTADKKPAPAEAKVRLAKTEVNSKASIANSASLKTKKKQDPPRRTQEETSKLTAANTKAKSLSPHLAISPSRHLPETQQLPKRLSPAPGFKSEAKPKVQLADKVQNFLSRYRQAYEHKNLSLFLSLFEPNAEENGELVSSLKDTYHQTFQDSDWIKIEFNSSRWAETAKGADVSSQFRLVLKPKGGRPVTSTGKMRIDLINHNDTFRVRTLDYSFNSVNSE